MPRTRTSLVSTALPSGPIWLAVTLLLTVMWPGAVSGQVGGGGGDPDGWNETRALELVQKARERRRLPVLDSSLQSYRADVSGHIYFFIDREANPEPVLLRADQFALELFWGQPDRVKQVVRGMRSEEQFPIRNFQYYLDRYTVIQNGFDDVIRVGEGRDIRNVIHPLAGVGRGYYDFRLADSTTIRLPGEPDPIRVYEVKVRPKQFELPGIVGSLYLERARGDLVRLAFTFTPASYIDPRNERVEVMLENALWEGRYWLPREQRLLVRRELPQFDIDVGTVIRAALTVENYELNVDLPPGFFGGREVVMEAGPEALAAYDFDEGLFDGLDDVGLAPGTDPGTLDAVDVEAIAGSIIRERFLRGIPELRFFTPTSSDILRYGRTQGLVTGAGAVFGIGQRELFGYAGYAWGRGNATAEIGWHPAGRPRDLAWFGRAYVNRPRNLGLRPAASGVIASLSAVAFGNDLRDVAITSGAELGVTVGDPRTGRLRLSAGIDRYRHPLEAITAAPLDETRLFRPAPPMDDIASASLRARYERRAAVGPFAVQVTPSLEVGGVWYPSGSGSSDGPGAGLSTASGWLLEDRAEGAFGRGRLDLQAEWADGRRATGLVLRGTAAFNVGAVPAQHLWYLGGRNTLPGHGFHDYVGDHAAVADATVWRTLVPRLLRLRLFAAAGWSELETDPPTPLDPDRMFWQPRPTDGVASSVGVGVGLVDGLIRLDYGLRTDDWDGYLMLSVRPDLWSFL
ncbi:MAG: hypothetical protein ACN0LA_13835 [Candidatus Longimicrobiales bacterium M2_2A_002]